MKCRVWLPAAILGAIISAAPAMAHHSFAAEYDAKKPIKVTGIVTKVEWMNPHVYFYIDVTDEKGNVANWALEMGPPNGLQKAGWTRHTIEIGDEVTVEGSQAKDGQNQANARSVVLTKTGQKLGAATSQNQP
jgi:hypothetical protein